MSPAGKPSRSPTREPSSTRRRCRASWAETLVPREIDVNCSYRVPASSLRHIEMESRARQPRRVRGVVDGMTTIGLIGAGHSEARLQDSRQQTVSRVIPQRPSRRILAGGTVVNASGRQVPALSIRHPALGGAPGRPPALPLYGQPLLVAPQHGEVPEPDASRHPPLHDERPPQYLLALHRSVFVGLVEMGHLVPENRGQGADEETSSSRGVLECRSLSLHVHDMVASDHERLGGPGLRPRCGGRGVHGDHPDPRRTTWEERRRAGDRLGLSSPSAGVALSSAGKAATSSQEDQRDDEDASGHEHLPKWVCSGCGAAPATSIARVPRVPHACVT